MMICERTLKTLLSPFNIEILCWVLTTGTFPVQMLKYNYFVN